MAQASNCDGSGILEVQTDQGFTGQVACPGCPACAGKAPQASQEGATAAVEVEVGQETLADIQRALAVVAGLPGDHRMTTEVAWGLVLTYLPALIEMSRQWMLMQENEPSKITTSAHPLFSTGR